MEQNNLNYHSEPDYKFLYEAWYRLKNSSEFVYASRDDKLRMAKNMIERLNDDLMRRPHYKVCYSLYLRRKGDKILEKIANAPEYSDLRINIADPNERNVTSNASLWDDLKKLYSISGRSNRLTFWIWYISIVPLVFLIPKLSYDCLSNASMPGMFGLILLWLVLIAFPGVPYMCLLIRRLHDIGYSAFAFVVLSALEFVFPFVVTVFFYGLMAGNSAKNKYGDKPYTNILNIYICLLLLVLEVPLIIFYYI